MLYFQLLFFGQSAQIDNLIENSTEFDSLKKSINKQVTKGNDLMADYVSLIELYYNNIFESIKEKVEV